MKTARKPTRSQRIQRLLTQYRGHLSDLYRFTKLYGATEEQLAQCKQIHEEGLDLTGRVLANRLKVRNPAGLERWLVGVITRIEAALEEVRGETKEVVQDLDLTKFTIPWMKV